MPILVHHLDKASDLAFAKEEQVLSALILGYFESAASESRSHCTTNGVVGPILSDEPAFGFVEQALGAMSAMGGRYQVVCLEELPNGPLLALAANARAAVAAELGVLRRTGVVAVEVRGSEI